MLASYIYDPSTKLCILQDLENLKLTESEKLLVAAVPGVFVSSARNLLDLEREMPRNIIIQDHSLSSVYSAYLAESTGREPTVESVKQFFEKKGERVHVTESTQGSIVVKRILLG